VPTTSPLVCRMHLAQVLLALRHEAGLTHEQLAQTTGLPRQTLSRLENADRKPNLAAVIKLLRALGVPQGDSRHQEIIDLAMEAAEAGWWDHRDHAAMGDRQRVVANIEHGSDAIREYQPFLVAGLAQTEEYMRCRAEAAGGQHSEAIVAARLRRQQLLAAPDAPAYSLVIEEQVVRRLAVPPSVMLGQLQHLLKLAEGVIDLQVLPVDARLGEGFSPRSPFAIYEHGDAPTVVVVDTVYEDLIDASAETAMAYSTMFDRLSRAAMSVEDSIRFIREAAARLTVETGLGSTPNGS
jgi:transcriptional regulator with XRE-family HTH domain